MPSRKKTKYVRKEPTRRQVKRALDLYEERLGKYANVVGLGIVNMDEEQSKSRSGKLAVAIYVRTKIPDTELPTDERLPKHLEIRVRGGLLQVPTQVVEQGEVQLEAPEKSDMPRKDILQTPPSLGKEPL